VRKAHTHLLPVQQSEIWRVQIIWPNGGAHYFGRFASKKEAVKWIADHAWLTRTVDSKWLNEKTDEEPSPK
jgi:hypothetical protein